MSARIEPIEVFIPYRQMRRHIYAILNATIDEKSTVLQSEDDKTTTIQLSDEKNIAIQWKEALLQELNFIGIVVRL